MRMTSTAIPAGGKSKSKDLGDQAREHIRQAIRLFNKYGASTLGQYRDIIIDVLHFAWENPKVRNDKAVGNDIEMLKHWLCDLGFETYEEELENQEHDRVNKIPTRKLHLYLHAKWQYRSSYQLFEERLKGTSQ